MATNCHCWHWLPLAALQCRCEAIGSFFPAGRCKMVLMTNIFLVGFMGSGKTTVARELAAALGLRVVDLDVWICERETMTLPGLFEERGESGFRVAERAALKAVVSQQGCVVALGGGAFCSVENRRLIESAQGLSVFLDLPWPVIESRLPEHDPTRPVFSSYQDAKTLFEQRRPDYQRADYILDLCGDESPADVVTMIRSSIGEVQCAI